MKKQITFLDKNNRRFHINISIEDGRFSMTGNSEGSGGQIVDEIEPDNTYQKQLVSMWHKYHLNDMKAGTPEQEEALNSERYKVWKENMGKLVAEAKRIESLAKSTDVVDYARKLGKLTETGKTETGTQYSYPAILNQELRELRSNYKKKKLGNATVGEVLKSLDSEYAMQCMYLQSISLYNVQLNGEPYRYGSAWLKRELPSNIQSQVDEVCDKIEWLEKSKPAYVPAVQVISPTRIRLQLPSLVAHVEYDVKKVMLAKAPWNKDDEKVWKYKVQVMFERIGEGDAPLADDSFDFYGSIAEYESGQKMGAEDLANVLRCRISDAQSAYMDVDSFASEFGYNKASELLRAYKGCEEARQALESIGFDEELMCNVLNEMTNENIG